MLIDQTGLLPVDYSFTLIDVQLPYMNMQSIFKGFFKLIIVPFFSLIFAALEKLCKIF